MKVLRLDRSFLADVFSTVLCAALALYFIYLFQTDLNATLTKNWEQPIAVITYRHNTAQRRFIDRLMWDRLRIDSFLYNGDVIRTADLSEAVISFIHGDIVEMFPNTLVQIFSDADGSRIDISGGGVSATASSDNGMVILSGDRRIIVDKDSVLQAVTEDGTLDVLLGEGNAFMEDINGTQEAVALEARSQSEIRRVQAAASIAPPELISPRVEQIFTYNSRNPSVRFVWSVVPGVRSYTLEAANNIEMLNPVLNVQVRSGIWNQVSYQTTALAEGVWYWRVTPVLSRASDNVSASQTRSFTVSRNITLSAPVLTAPAENGFLNIETGRRDFLFSWRRNNEAAFYTLRISANSDMSSPVVEHTTTDTYYRYGADETAITEGVWYWSVQYVTAVGAASSGAGTASPVSTRSFAALQGEIVQRAVFPPDNYTIADNFLADTRFTWKTNLLENRFQVSASENFTSILIDEPAGMETYTIRSLPLGDYFWRITGGIGAASSGAASSGAASSERRLTSSPRRFKVVDSLPPPNLNWPDSGVASQLGNVVVKEGTPVTFSWEALQGAQYYMFKLYNRDVSQVPVIESMVFDTSFIVNMDGMGDGAYTWTVQGLARESVTSSRRTGLTASQLNYMRHLRPITIEHPRSGFEYAGLDASRRPDTARWSSPEQALNIEFKIATDSRMSNVFYRERNVNRSFTLPRLPEGDFYWVVSAQTPEGFDITSVPSHLKVLPIPRLPVPLNRSPSDGYTYGTRQIASSRSLNFLWARVQGANGYIVTIFQGTGRTRRTIAQSEVITGTSYTIEDIRLLGRGTFYWQVEAVNSLPDGFVEQRGVLEENTLIIDIPNPPRIRTRDTGVLYGL